MGPRLLAVIALVVLTSGCQSTPAPVVSHTVPPSIQAPPSIARIAVLYPSAASRDVRDAYNQLEAELFALKTHRPLLRVVERRQLAVLLEEQRLHVGGMVSEETAVHVGRILGADSAVLYHIEGPTLRDIVFARFSGRVPPVTVTTKVILVESGEVVYHNVVSVALSTAPEPLHTDVRAALQQAVSQTSEDLRRAFR